MSSLEDRAALADAVRELLDIVVRTDTGAHEVARATGLVQDAIEVLQGRVLERMRWPQPEQFQAGMAPYNPVIGVANPIAPPMVCRNLDDGSVEGTVTLQPIHEGPPGSVHGGISALLLDQLLGHAIAAADQPGMTVELTVRYRKPTPYGVPLLLRARRTASSGRLVEATGEILAHGVVAVEAHGRFLSLAPEQRARMLAAMGGDELS